MKQTSCRNTINYNLLRPVRGFGLTVRLLKVCWCCGFLARGRGARLLRTDSLSSIENEASTLLVRKGAGPPACFMFVSLVVMVAVATLMIGLSGFAFA